MEEGINDECADEDGSPSDELRARAPEGRAEHEADQEEGEYEIAHFPRGMKVARDDGHGG